MLLQKAYRAILAHKKAYLACIFLIAIGMLLFTAMGGAAASMAQSARDFYAEYRLADAVAELGAIPISEVDRLRLIEGIQDISHRTKIDVRVEIPGTGPSGGVFDGIIRLRLVSFDPYEYRPINDFMVYTGLRPYSQDEILTNIVFMRGHDLSIGDTIAVYFQGRRHDFGFAGGFMSPEYVYLVQGFTDILPDETGFGVAYITTEAMNSITGQVGVANNLTFALQPGYEFEDIRTVLQDALQPYGLISLTAREDILSYVFTDMEIESMADMSTSLPIVFIGLSVVILYLMMKRIIEQDRTQIGTLKALGYSKAALALHYASYGGITGAIGGFAGWLFGFLLSDGLLDMMMGFYMLPVQDVPFTPVYFFLAVGISTAAGMLGAFMGASKPLNLKPAEAMRPESPKGGKSNIIGKIFFLKYIFNSRGFMTLRSISRNPVRSAFVIVGVTFSFAVLTFTGSINNMIQAMLYSQFTDIRLYDIRLTLDRPINYSAAIETAAAVPHITQAEALLELPVVLVNEHIRQGVTVTGVSAQGNLFRVADTNTRAVYAPPTDGLIITNGLAEQLNARAGDILYLSSPLSRDDIPLPITKVIEQNLGTGAFMELRALAALFHQPKSVNTVVFNTNNERFILDYFRDSRTVTSIETTGRTLERYMSMLGPITEMFFIFQIFGVAIAFAIIYNITTVSLSERQREFTTLRVLGLTLEEVCEIMNLELWLLAIIGMVLGIPFASLLVEAVNSMMDSGTFSMPTDMPIMAYATGVGGCIAAIILSNITAKNKIRRFDLVEALKDRE